MSALELLTAESLNDPAVVHGFTTRQGGVSTGPYESLNLSWSRGDTPGAIEENRDRVSAAMGGISLVFANQTHSDIVLTVPGKPQTGWSMGEGDSLITNQPGLGLCAQAADCVPILLFDPENRAIAAIHSGWRGTLKQIAAKTIARMSEAYGTQPSALHAAIGPAISKDNYRVGPEVLEQFETAFGELDPLMIGPRDDEGGAGLDVREAVYRQLIDADIPSAAIVRRHDCTFDDAQRFFSCRRAAREGHAGVFGGQCGIIALRA